MNISKRGDLNKLISEWGGGGGGGVCASGEHGDTEAHRHGGAQGTVFSRFTPQWVKIDAKSRH